MSWVGSIPAGSSAYLDANIIIYAVEGIAPCDQPIKSLFLRADANEVTLATSELTVAEALVLPIRLNAQSQIRTYRELLAPDGSLRMIPVGFEVLERAAALRAEVPSLKLPDAIHGASALLSGADFFVTNDRRFTQISGLKVISISGS